MCELLVGLPAVTILGIDDFEGEPIRVHIERADSKTGCPEGGVVAESKGRRVVELVDLPVYGRPSRLVWHKHRFRCLEATCPSGSWSESDPKIAAPRMALADRTGRWVTEQVGRNARSVNEVVGELSCDWHTINDAVVAYGSALVDDDPNRFGTVHALGLDEVLFARIGTWRRQHFSTSIVDVGTGQLLDVVPGRSGKEPTAWLMERPLAWRDEVAFATLDLSGPYRAVFDTCLPNAVQVADPFHPEN